jgi:hypothetical protein
MNTRVHLRDQAEHHEIKPSTIFAGLRTVVSPPRSRAAVTLKLDGVVGPCREQWSLMAASVGTEHHQPEQRHRRAHHLPGQHRVSPATSYQEAVRLDETGRRLRKMKLRASGSRRANFLQAEPNPLENRPEIT